MSAPRRKEHQEMGTPRELPGWTFAALVTAIVAWTCRPVFGNPVLDPDDYRYLDLVQSLVAGRVSFLDAAIVENRWDHVWWLDMPEKVRFFRPTVVASYLVDHLVWGDRVARGLLVTNVLVHLGCALLVAALLRRWLGSGVAALLGAALFAAFSGHAEAIWYVAGRTDSIAALFFLAGLVFHVRGAERPGWRPAAVAAYAVAFLTKENTVALPLVALAHDTWMAQRGGWRENLARDRWLYAGYAAAAALVGAVRLAALAGGTSGLVAPYLVSPLAPGFATHLWVQLRSYSENVLLARPTPPFLTVDGLAANSSVAGLVLLAVAGVGAVFALRKDRRAWFAVLFALVTWAPTSIAYVSERYLYLPALGVALAAALLPLRATNKALRFAALALVAGWTLHQASQLEWKHDMAINRIVRPVRHLADKLATLRGSIAPGAKLLVVNLPGSWLEAQFLGPMARTVLGDPTLEARALTLMPRRDDLGVLLRVERRGTASLGLLAGTHRGREFSLMEAQREILPWIALEPGRVVERVEQGYALKLVRAADHLVREVEVTLPAPLEEYTVVRFVPDLSPGVDERGRYANARFEVVRP